MKNPKNPKERNLLKGAIRRVFSRSELRRKALMASQTDHIDPSRKRVTRWSKCAKCNKLEPSYLCEIDHMDPVIPIGLGIEDMSWDQIIDRVWCDERNLQALCKDCHKAKSKEEAGERRKNKKQRSEK